MVFIDIHCHLELLEKYKKISEVVGNAQKENLGIILNCGINPKTNRQALEFGRKYNEVKVCLGIYPNEALDMSKEKVLEEMNFIKKNKDKMIAIGESGLDLKENDNLEWQEFVFRENIKIAKKLDIPIVVHSRKAEQRVIEILEEMDVKKVLMHCFCGKKKLVKRIIKNDWSLSVPTSVKFSEQFQELVEITPLEQLFCETDSPFLHPDKEFPNEPANVIESYKKIAEIKKLSLQKIEKEIENNFKRFFNL